MQPKNVSDYTTDHFASKFSQGPEVSPGSLAFKASWFALEVLPVKVIQSRSSKGQEAFVALDSTYSEKESVLKTMAGLMLAHSQVRQKEKEYKQIIIE